MCQHMQVVAMSEKLGRLVDNVVLRYAVSSLVRKIVPQQRQCA
jgi:hypothetical protein